MTAVRIETVLNKAVVISPIAAPALVGGEFSHPVTLINPLMPFFIVGLISIFGSFIFLIIILF